MGDLGRVLRSAPRKLGANRLLSDGHGAQRIVTIDFPHVDSPKDRRAEEVAGKTEQEALAELLPQAVSDLRREPVAAAIAEAEDIAVSDADLRRSDPQTESSQDGALPQSRASRRDQPSAGECSTCLSGRPSRSPSMRRGARNMPHPHDHAPVEQELPELGRLES